MSLKEQYNIPDSYKFFADGKWKDAEGGSTFDVYCPATGEHLTKVANASK